MWWPARRVESDQRRCRAMQHRRMKAARSHVRPVGGSDGVGRRREEAGRRCHTRRGECEHRTDPVRAEPRGEMPNAAFDYHLQAVAGTPSTTPSGTGVRCAPRRTGAPPAESCSYDDCSLAARCSRRAGDNVRRMPSVVSRRVHSGRRRQEGWVSGESGQSQHSKSTHTHTPLSLLSLSGR